MPHNRYAIYYAPEPGPLADFGAAWLGWDLARGCEVPHPDVAQLPEAVEALTRRPRKYGFHGTVKPPFRLAAGQTRAGLERAAKALCADRSPVPLDGLKVARLGRFVALLPETTNAALSDLASGVVAGLDSFRAPSSEDELARRRAARLTPRQEEMLRTWGYPHVMQDFRFHITLSGPLKQAQADAVVTALTPTLAPLAERLVIRDLCLVGERPDGRFETLKRLPLGQA